MGVSLGCAIFLRGRLLDERRVLELDPRIGNVAVEDPLALAMAERQVVLASAGLGVFRPLAIDFLWLRASHLQRSMNFFEAATLSGLITRLQPRLPEVWRFQAHNLAYNLSATLPPRERFPWVLRGIKLLRDEGLRYNPQSDLIALDLALVFQYKIGRDSDAAGYLYRNELAAIFDVDPESPQGRARYREWKLDPEFIKRIDDKYGVAFDFRAAEAHGIYWSEQGLDRAQAAPEPEDWIVSLLTNVGRHSLWQLFNSGRPVKAPLTESRYGVRVRYAFVPDLRFANATRRALEEHASLSSDAARTYQEFLKRDVLYRFLLLGDEAARARFEVTRDRMEPSAPALEKLLLEFQWTAGGSKKSALMKLADYLDAYLLLELAGESDLAEGFRALARLVHSTWLLAEGGGAPPPFDAYVRTAAHRRIEEWRKQPRLKKHLAPLLKIFSKDGEGILSLPETQELPLSLEHLNPPTVLTP